VTNGILCFADFELDPGRCQLRRGDRILKLEKIPMDLLMLLVEADGQLVTRDQIIERIWGRDVFLDTEHGINTAIRKIRIALRDDPESPRFVETITGRGYRFVAPVTLAPANGNGSAPAAANAPSVEATATEATAAQRPAAPSTARVPAGAPSAEPPVPMLRGWIAALAAVLVALILILVLKPTLLRSLLSPRRSDLQIQSLAVLPLENLSGDPSQDYFADGMTDELITMLAKTTNLRVVSRTSAMQYKGARRPLRDIARELGVDGILEGSVARSGNRVHMTVQLIYAPSDTHFWAESYDRDLNQVYALPSELAQTIAKEVKSIGRDTSPPRYINPEAHDAYLRGVYLFIGFDAVHSLENFEKAIQLQPDYAAAWAGMADAYMIGAVDGERPASEVSSQGEAAARKAVELDDSSGSAHNSRAAWYFFFARDWQRADAESRRAVELAPGDAGVHHVRSFVLAALNRWEESLAESKRENELDAFARTWALGYAYLRMRQFDAAISDFKLRIQALPTDEICHMYLAQAYWRKQMYPEWERETETTLQLSGRRDAAQALHRAFEQGGEKAAEQWGVNDTLARSRTTYVSPFDIALSYAFLRDKNETLHYLEESYRQRAPWLSLLQSEAVFDFLHFDPRYIALVKKIGLPLDTHNAPQTSNPPTDRPATQQ
jgi:TolB-like protein/DNA-binding winged helix-turn-helix (wHTH) protein/Tfp pilus assembly protein PilF